ARCARRRSPTGCHRTAPRARPAAPAASRRRPPPLRSGGRRRLRPREAVTAGRTAGWFWPLSSPSSRSGPLGFCLRVLGERLFGTLSNTCSVSRTNRTDAWRRGLPTLDSYMSSTGGVDGTDRETAPGAGIHPGEGGRTRLPALGARDRRGRGARLPQLRPLPPELAGGGGLHQEGP